MPEQFNFEKSFPAITEWVRSHGWIEIGQTDEEQSFVRAIDEGGLVWEGKSSYPSLDHAWRALENALKKWGAENG
ncbi:MAG: hypothetical protein KGJ80_04730 [Chloroflexota bacterium]|nr:hypothetical protein [Chloroflexota bacterium]